MAKKIARPYLTEKQFYGLWNQLLIKAQNSNFKCYSKTCDKSAIDSHILQKNGVLAYIIQNGHLFTLHNEVREKKFKFKRIGADKIFTFKGFCQPHDTDIFKEIETKDFSLDSYKNQLLLSYRGILNELRKKEIDIKFWQLLKDDPTMSNAIDPSVFWARERGVRAAIKDLEFYRSELEEDLITTREHKPKFRFVVRRLPFVPVCTSSIFSFESNGQMMRKIGTLFFDKTLDSIIINLLPHEKETFLIVGTHQNCSSQCHLYLQQFSFRSDKELLKEISDILIRNVETWVTSEHYYKHNIDRHENYISNFIKEHGDQYGVNIKVSINMFE